MKFQAKFARAILGFVGALAIGTTLVMPAVAADSVTQVVTSGGSLTASVADATMGSVVYSNTAGSTTGSLNLTVNDPRGSSLGWNVTIASTDFDYQGTSTSGLDIPNTGFAITAAGTPVMTAGQVVNATGGPKVPATGAVGTLDSARKTIQANDGFGSGSYTQNIPVSLVIPALSQTGTYVATLTVAITSAP